MLTRPCKLNGAIFLVYDWLTYYKPLAHVSQYFTPTYTVTYLKIQTPTYFAVNTKTQTKRFYYGVMPPKDADGIANSDDPNQRSRLILVCTVCQNLSENL